MALSTQVRFALNRLLARGNLQISTLKSEKAEVERLRRLSAAGHFDRPAYPLPDGLLDFDFRELQALLDAHGEAIAALHDPARNSVGYRPDNSFFMAPDSLILYLMLRRFAPSRYLEIGCGSSTRIVRQAIRDGDLATRVVAVDPHPRVDVADMVDELHLSRLEDFGTHRILETIRPGDILFIDSSHEVSTGNDVVQLFLNVLPNLPAGVIVHVHDIFLPFEYPAAWTLGDRYDWGEQYLLHLLLLGGRFKVLWPGFAAQRLAPDSVAWLPGWARNPAQSFWMVSR